MALSPPSACFLLAIVVMGEPTDHPHSVWELVAGKYTTSLFPSGPSFVQGSFPSSPVCGGGAVR